MQFSLANLQHDEKEQEKFKAGARSATKLNTHAGQCIWPSMGRFKFYRYL
jgi:hypothetical protein